MGFEPDKIKREHILKAAEIMDSGEYEVTPSTGYDVIINGKKYPPKELMRFAHEQATGEFLWDLGGGEPTNKYLKDLGFTVVEKAKEESNGQSELEFIELLKAIGSHDAKAFFVIADSLLRNIGISALDKRLSFNTRKDNRLVIVVGQRYCLAHVPKEELPWHFISIDTTKSTQKISVNQFDGKPVAYYCRCAEAREVMERMDGMIAATMVELNRTKKSGFRNNHNNSIFERAMTDQKYRLDLYEKAFGNVDSLTGRVWKLGCTWGEGAPNFYDLIKKHSIVISDQRTYYPGDLVIITEGFSVKAIAKVLEHPKSALEFPQWKDEFLEYEISLKEGVTIAAVEWYELLEDDQFTYNTRQGNVEVQSSDIKANAINLWNERNLSYWIFQCNPNDFDFDTAVRKMLLHEWTVTTHKDKIKIGDKVILWLSGKRSGCYALAEVTSAPHESSQSTDSHLWKTKPKNELKAGIRITHNLLDQPLLWNDIKGVPALVEMNVGLQGTNFTASRKQFRTLLELIDKQTKPSSEMSNEFPNVILYGPPGTGKTYTAIAEAVKLATGEEFQNHTDAKKRFDELRSSERIQFVTFHQNYSYEDFVLGLKPDLDNTGKGLMFTRKEGVFYKLARNAENNYIQSKSFGSGLRPFNEVFDEFLKPLQESGKEIEVKMASQTTSFWITEINDYNLSFRKQSGGDSHTLSFATIEELYYKKRNFTSGLRYYYEPLLKELWTLGETNVSPVKMQNYVLVIDEINRANISRVFGELITLLEPDKRIGKENELRVSIPNSETPFGVPPNLFVIGTMNTADKSIALVDIALRRRFQFKGFYPTKELLDKLVATRKLTLKSRELLDHINGKILELNKSADFLIGHAYFIGVPDSDLKEVLQLKVIPLLLEYFSGKQETVREILEGSNTPMQYKKENFRWE